MVSAGIAAFVMAGVMTTFVFLGRSGVTFQNYNDMEAQSRRALELFAQDVRQASTITWNSQTQLTLTVNSVTVAYSYSGGDFTRQIGGGAIGSIITSITAGTFSFRAFNLDGDELPLTTAAERTAANGTTKQLQLSMQSERSRQTLATSTNSVLSARFILRNIFVTA